MKEFVFHGRGGQGAVTAVELMAQAAIFAEKYAQGFPFFGPERRGAPVTAFLRVSDEPIFSREKIEAPDVVVVMDPSLLDLVDTSRGLRKGGLMVVNIPPERSGKLEAYRENYQVAEVDASRIALDVLGIPINNTAIIGALVKTTGIVDIKDLSVPFQNRFGRLTEKNQNAALRAYDETSMSGMPDSILKETDEKTALSASEGRLKSEALYPWTEVEMGCDIVRLGSSNDFITGSWRTTGRPVTDFDKCIKCGLCWIMCPDVAYRENASGFYDLNERFCKGCGICAVECPKDAIIIEEE
jgi:pyruvate ferredoxin oxidoreductase gamma subunit